MTHGRLLSWNTNDQRYLGEGSAPSKLKEQRIEKVNDTSLFILTNYSRSSLSIGVNLEAALIRDLAVKSATP